MFELLFGTFKKGDKVEATFIPGYYKVGTKEPVTITGTLENVRTVSGRTYVEILQDRESVSKEGNATELQKFLTIELKDEDIHNLKNLTPSEPPKPESKKVK